MNGEGDLLRQATLIVESVGTEPIKAEPAGDGTWLVSGAGEKTVLHLKDPTAGNISVEVTLPEGQSLVEVYWHEKTASVRVTPLPALTPAGLHSVPGVSPGMQMAGGRSDGTCPADTLYGQESHSPTDGWSAGTSELDTGSGETLLRADKFVDVSGEICDIHWYGLMLYFGADWTECVDSDPAFEIKFYEDGGTGPGAELCRYTVYPTITGTGMYYHTTYQFELKYFEVPSLDPCCTVDPDGWVSIQGLGDTTCWFLWMSSGDGDGSSYFDNNGTVEGYYYDNSFCLTGQYIPTYGACCDDSTATCTDGVERLDCPPPLRFAANTLCADLDPACGDITTCEHSIVLTDDYGDGWNGGTVDVLVNGAVVLDNATIGSGAGPVTYYFQAATGDDISTVYVAGSYSYENEYHVYDVNGTQICADGTGGNTPTGGYCGLGFCEADPCDGNEPANDDCTGAFPLNAPYPQVANGTNYCATVDCPGTLDWNATWWSIELPYAVNNLNISFCGNGFEINNVGVVVYDSCPVDCPNYILYTAIDWYGCSDGVTSPSIDWLELAGPTTVYFPVYFNEGEMGPYMFEVNVDEVLPPPNDFCEDAIPVGVPSTTAGWTTGGTVDATFPSCGTAGTPSAPGVWYSVVGTGNTMTASLCSGATAYDTKLTVYCPDCVDAICVDGNDDFCSLQSEVSWCSQYGANYLILVHGYSSAAGDFELDVYDDGVPCEADVACLPLGACCLLTAECIITTEIDCLAQDGEYHGDDTDCGWTPAAAESRFDCNDYIVGTLDGASPTWDRVYGCNVDVNCAAVCSDSSSDGQYYAVFPITTTVTENLEAEIVVANTTLSDTVMTLYCDPFDPNDPFANAVAYDDDGAGYPYSGFYDSDGITLPAGVTYYLVLSTFSAGDVGDFEICLGGHFTVGGGGPGACCLPDGTCEVMEAGDCSAAGGFFGGAGTDCATYECPEIPGACCLDAYTTDPTCVITVESCCDYAGGMFMGPGTDCGMGMAVLLSEDFNAGIPVDWTVTDDDGSGLMWTTNDVWGDDNWTGGDGLCADVSSDVFGTSTYDTSLISPILDLSGAAGATLDADINYQNVSSDEYFDIDVSYDGGGSWANLLSWNEDHGTFHGTPGEHVTLDIAGGSATTQIRFRYYDPTASWNWEVQVDNVVISTEVQTVHPCPFTVELTAEKDSFLRKVLRHRNEGANPRLRVRGVFTNRALVDFDLADVPTTNLEGASLALTIDDTFPPHGWWWSWWPCGFGDVDVHRVVEPWEEGNGKGAGLPWCERSLGSGPGVTWACALDPAIECWCMNCPCYEEWHGGEYVQATAPSVTHHNFMSGVVEWDVTQDVLDVFGGAPFEGWIVKKKLEWAFGKVYYYSREGAAEAADLTLAPRLVLTYGAGTPMAATGYGLFVSSSVADVAIEVDPSGMVTPPFQQSFEPGTEVTLIAPETFEGWPFLGWELNTVLIPGGDPVLNVVLDEHTFVRAVYDTPAEGPDDPEDCLENLDPPWEPAVLSVESTVGDTWMTVSMPDVCGATDGAASFQRVYAPNTTVSVTAPATFEGANFRVWELDGVRQTPGQRTIQLSVTQDGRSLVAIYGVRPANGRVPAQPGQGTSPPEQMQNRLP